MFFEFNRYRPNDIFEIYTICIEEYDVFQLILDIVVYILFQVLVHCKFTYGVARKVRSGWLLIRVGWDGDTVEH